MELVLFVLNILCFVSKYLVVDFIFLYEFYIECLVCMGYIIRF